MRYKQPVTVKLENLHNSLNTLRYKVFQGATTADDLNHWFDTVKEKLEEIQTLINSENEQAQGTW